MPNRAAPHIAVRITDSIFSREHAASTTISPAATPSNYKMTDARPQPHFVAPSVPRRRWVIACVLGLGVLINYFDRVNISVSQEALHAAFGISAVQFGYLLSAYSWTYAALQLPCGVLLDRFGVKFSRSRQHLPLERCILRRRSRHGRR